jgi:hypothetical protein
MSRTFTLQGTTNIISASYYPPIELGEDDYCLALIGLHTFNTIPNIEEGANKFYYDRNKSIAIPTGSYEISDIEKYLQRELQRRETNTDSNSSGTIVKDNALFSLKANNNTIKCEIECKYSINFSLTDSIGKLLGFSGKTTLKEGQLHVSDVPVSIIKVGSIRVECNIITGAYYNNKLSHTLFEFSPQVDPGYAINIEPRNNIYLPINVKTIHNITLRLIAQDGVPVNFRGENIVVRLELKRWV